MKQVIQLTAILVAVFVVGGCKESTEPSENKQQTQESVSKPNEPDFEAFAKVVLQSITERPSKTGEQERFVVIECRGPDSLWIGPHQVTPEELKTIPTIQDQHNMPHNIILRVAKGAFPDGYVPVFNILEPAAANKVISELASDMP